MENVTVETLINLSRLYKKRNTRLEARVAQLEAILRLRNESEDVAAIMEATNLPPMLCQILALLSRGGVVFHDEIFEHLYGDRDDPPSRGSMRVLLSRYRSDLADMGVFVISVRGQGYRLKDESAPIVRSWVDDARRKDTEGDHPSLAGQGSDGGEACDGFRRGERSSGPAGTSTETEGCVDRGQGADGQGFGLAEGKA